MYFIKSKNINMTKPHKQPDPDRKPSGGKTSSSLKTESSSLKMTPPLTFSWNCNTYLHRQL